MQKIDSLRAAINAALPELENDRSRLRIWIERGAAQCRQTQSESFGFAFQLNVLVIELAQDIAVLGLAVFRWLRVNQPSLLAPGTDGFTFDADILDNSTADVLLQLTIDQNVQVITDDANRTTLQYLAEPDPLFLDSISVGGITPPPLLTGAIVMEDTSPPWET